MTSDGVDDSTRDDDPEVPLGRATGVITFWNLISRLTGFARVLATTAALGVAVLGDTYGRTNQVSNVLFELLAGGMLFSVLVPSFVFELRGGGRERARHLASALTTRAALALGILVLVGIQFRHQILELLSAGANQDSRAAQIELGSILLIFILPQLVLYLIGSVASALLQADRRFAATSFAPVLNNVVVAGTMIAFALVHDPADGLMLSAGEKILLGGGTLAGTAAMTLVPLIALRMAGMGLGFRWRMPDVDLRALARRGIWGAGHIGLNEVLILSTVVLAGAVDGGAVAYQTAFTFFLLPHALLAHPIFTAFYPRLSQLGSDGDHGSFAALLGRGLRSMIFLLLPAAALLGVAAVPGLGAFQIAQFSGGGARFVALVLAAYLVGLVGYSTFFLLTRAAYALDDARAPTLVNLVMTIGTVAGMVTAVRIWTGIGLMVAFGLITSFWAIVGSIALLRHLQRRLGVPVPVAAIALRSGAAAITAAAAGSGVAVLIGWDGRLQALVAAGIAVLVGLVVHIGALFVLGGSDELDEWARRLRRIMRPVRRLLTGHHRRRLVQIGIVIAIGLLLAGSLAATRHRTPDTVTGDRTVSGVVVFTIPGLTLDDVDSGLMPELDRLAGRGAIAVTNVRTASDEPGLVSSYASLSAGNRVGGSDDDPMVYAVDEEVAPGVAASALLEAAGRTVGENELVVANFGMIERDIAPRGGSSAGALADAAAIANRRTAIVSNPTGGPGGSLADRFVPAALAGADSDGIVDAGSIAPSLLGQLVDTSGVDQWVADPEAHARAVRDAQDRADIVFVDPGETSRAAATITAIEALDESDSDTAQEAVDGPDRTASDLDELVEEIRLDALRRTDRVLADVRAGLRDDTVLLVIGLNQSDWALTPFVASGPGIPHGYLDSGSTHRPALITLPDVAPTILSTLGIEPPAEMIGQPLRYRPADSSWSEARQLDQLLENRASIHSAMTALFIGANSVLYAFVLLLVARRRPFDGRLGTVVALAASTCAAWPVATYLLRIGTSLYNQGYGTIALSWIIAITIAAIAARLGRQRLDPVLLIALFTIGVLLADLATGAHLQVGSFFGYMPHTRFIGLGNSGFAILTAATITASGVLFIRARDRESAWWIGVGLGIAVILAVGAPWMGTDVGGIITLVPVLILVLAALRGRPIGPRAILVAGLCAVAVLAIAVGIDALRAVDDRTHIGRFFLEAGEGSNALDTLRRKWSLNFTDLRTRPVLWIVPALALVGFGIVMRSRRLRRTLPTGSAGRIVVIGTLAAGTIGWLSNDSGVIVLALSCVFLGPLLIGLRPMAAAHDTRVGGADPTIVRNDMATPDPVHAPSAAPTAHREGEDEPTGAPDHGRSGDHAGGEQIVAIVPAKDRADSITATVQALLALTAVDRILVVDDGSTDDTAERAATAGAEVLRLPSNRGKGAAVLAGVDATPDAEIYLLIDADLAETAEAADLLLGPVRSGAADLCIGVLPSAGRRGGFGTIRSFAGRGIRTACGIDTRAPLSGQRAVRADHLREVTDAERFGLEVAMTIDIARNGGRIIEVDVPMNHRHTGRSISGFAHRGRQGIDIATALWPRLTTARQRMGILAVLTVLIASGAILVGSHSAPDSTPGGAPASKVVVFGLDPFSLDDLLDRDTPNLDRLRDRGSLGVMSVRTRQRRSDTAEGFLAVGSGARLHAPASADLFLPSDRSIGPVDVATHVENLTGERPDGEYATIGGAELIRTNDEPEAAGRPGDLTAILERNGRSAGFVGSADRPGYFGEDPIVSRPAALATMGPDFGADGTVDGLHVEDPSSPFGIRIDPDAVADAVVDRLLVNDLVVVDPGDLERAAAFRTVASGRAASAAWNDAVERTDQALGAVLDQLDDDVFVLVVSLSATDGDYHLQPVLAAGPAVPVGRIQSVSTKRDSLSAVTDIAPTILHALGIPKPSAMPGNALRYEDTPVSLDELRDLDRDTIVREHTYSPQSRWYLRVHQILYVAAAVLLLVNHPIRRRIGVLRPAILGLAAYPMTSFLVRLVPDVSAVRWAQVGLAVVLAAGLGLLASRRRTVHHAGMRWIAGLTTAVIVIDTWFGTPLQMSSWLGSSMHNAGRFYGVPNTTFAVLAAASIIWGVLHVERSHRRNESIAVVAAVFLVCLVSAGLPMLGADVGTLLTLTPVYGLMLFALSGRRLDLRALIVAGVAMIVVVVGAAAADLSRPARSRTHLGNFAQQVLDEGPSALFDSFLRKQSANFRIMSGSLWTDLVLLAVVVLVVALATGGRFRRVLPPGSPRRIGFWAIVGAALLGFATNDSGPIVLALCAAQLLAYTLVLVLETPDDTGAPPYRAIRPTSAPTASHPLEPVT